MSRTGTNTVPQVNIVEQKMKIEEIDQGTCNKMKDLSLSLCNGLQSKRRFVDYTTGSPNKNVETNLVIFKRNANIEVESKFNMNENPTQKLYLSFIVDSEATENLTNSEEIFTTFHETGVCIIKCANKDSKANLIAEGKGSVNLITNQNVSFQMKNLIYSKNLSENLLSLSHFAEAGYAIYLDDKVVYIFNPRTNRIFASGIYEKPY